MASQGWSRPRRWATRATPAVISSEDGAGSAGAHQGAWAKPAADGRTNGMPPSSLVMVAIQSSAAVGELRRSRASAGISSSTSKAYNTADGCEAGVRRSGSRAPKPPSEFL